MNARIPPCRKELVMIGRRGFLIKGQTGTSAAHGNKSSLEYFSLESSTDQKSFGLLFICFLLLFCASTVTAKGSISKEMAIRILRSTAVKINRFNENQVATGHLLKVPGHSDYRLLVTNRHVIDGQDSIKLSISSLDNNVQIIDTISTTLKLFNKNGDSLFIVEESGLDVAFILVPISSLFRTNMDVIATLDTVFYLSTYELKTGNAIVYCGFPFGLTVNRFEPLLRFGRIAGIDSASSQIYIEADVFGGSSGSPVFLDLDNKENAQYFNKHARMFVGIIAEYLQVVQLVPIQDSGKVDSIRGENIGIAIVIPAQEIKEFSRKAVEILLQRINK